MESKLFQECNMCHFPISDVDDAVKNDDFICHKNCATCHHCKTSLAKKPWSYLYNRKLFCNETCLQFEPKILHCQKCSQELIDSDLIRNIKDRYYHAACFKCDTCNKTLTTGQIYKILKNKISCQEHLEIVEKEENSQKRIPSKRTVINSVQRDILLKYFGECEYPTVNQIIKISNKTNLQYNTVKYWFQNNRARRST